MTQFKYDTFKQDLLDDIEDLAEKYDLSGSLIIKELHEVMHYILEKTLNHLEITREAYSRGRIAGLAEAKRKLEEIN